jgi:hypothetical protein
VLTNSAAGNYFFELKIIFTIFDGIRPREKNFVCDGGGHEHFFNSVPKSVLVKIEGFVQIQLG